MVIQAAANIELALHVIVAAVLQLDLLYRIFTGPFAHAVDHAAGADLAIKHRSWALEDFNALQREWIGSEIRQPAAVGLTHAIQIVGIGCRCIAANIDLVEAWIEASTADTDTGRISYRFFYRDCFTVGNLLGGHYADALCGFQQRRIGLGSSAAAVSKIAGHGSNTGLAHLVRFDRQRHKLIGVCIGRCRHQHVAGTALLRCQPGAAEQRIQGGVY